MCSPLSIKFYKRDDEGGKEVVSYGKADSTARRALVMMEGVMPPFRRVDYASLRQLASTMFMQQTEKTRNEEIME